MPPLQEAIILLVALEQPSMLLTQGSITGDSSGQERGLLGRAVDFQGLNEKGLFLHVACSPRSRRALLQSNATSGREVPNAFGEKIRIRTRVHFRHGRRVLLGARHGRRPRPEWPCATDAQQRSSLDIAEAGEIAEFHQLGRLGTVLRQTVQRLVQVEQSFWPFRAGEFFGLFLTDSTAAVLEALLRRAASTRMRRMASAAAAKKCRRPSQSLPAKASLPRHPPGEGTLRGPGPWLEVSDRPALLG